MNSRSESRVEICSCPIDRLFFFLLSYQNFLFDLGQGSVKTSSDIVYNVNRTNATPIDRELVPLTFNIANNQY